MPALQPYLSSPFSGNSLRPCYPSERQIIRSAVTGGASHRQGALRETGAGVGVRGCAYERIAEEGCSATTLRRPRDEWIEAGVMATLRELALEAYDKLIGLQLSDVAVDCCITKAPCVAVRKLAEIP